MHSKRADHPLAPTEVSGQCAARAANRGSRRCSEREKLHMTGIAPGWEIIGQKTRNPLVHMAFIVLQVLLLHAEPVEDQLYQARPGTGGLPSSPSTPSSP